MKIETRLTDEFIELEVDLVKDTIWKGTFGANETIESLIKTLKEILDLNDMEITYKISEK